MKNIFLSEHAPDHSLCIDYVNLPLRFTVLVVEFVKVQKKNEYRQSQASKNIKVRYF